MPVIIYTIVTLSYLFLLRYSPAIIPLEPPSPTSPHFHSPPSADSAATSRIGPSAPPNRPLSSSQPHRYLHLPAEVYDPSIHLLVNDNRPGAHHGPFTVPQTISCACNVFTICVTCSSHLRASSGSSHARSLNREKPPGIHSVVKPTAFWSDVTTSVRHATRTSPLQVQRHHSRQAAVQSGGFGQGRRVRVRSGTVF